MAPFIGLIFIILFITVFITIIRIPIIIAQMRSITGSDLTIIAILSWLGIFFGLTWIIGLVLSLVYEPKPVMTNLDKLDKLYDLMQKGVISQSEFNQYKSQLLKNPPKKNKNIPEQ